MHITSPFAQYPFISKQLGSVLPLFDTGKKTIVDLFAGGGTVYINALPLYEKVVVNDANRDLLVLQKKCILSDSTVNRLRSLCVNKNDGKGFIKLRRQYNEHHNEDVLGALLICSKKHTPRYDAHGKYTQVFGRRTFNRNTEKEMERFLQQARTHKKKLVFSYKDFHSVPIVMDAFYYVNPPVGLAIKGDIEISNVRLLDDETTPIPYNQEKETSLYKYLLDLNDVGNTFMLHTTFSKGEKHSWIATMLINDGFNYKLIPVHGNRKDIIIFNYRTTQKNDVFLVVAQDGTIHNLGYFYRVRHKIEMNKYVIGKYKSPKVAKEIIRQMAISIKRGNKLYRMPPEDVDIEKKWYIK